MLREEKRKQERYTFERPPEGTLFLVRDGVRLPVAGINDISNSGVSLDMNDALAVSQPVTVEYADAVVCVQVRGTVTWCAPASDPAKAGSFVLGVELASPMLLLSMFQKY
jgi:sulfur relay (sulfurtransferase) complex TusBCD TusD component (DsrE family)